MHSFAESAHSADMIRVVVGDKNAHDILEIKPHLTQVFLDRPRRNARIDQDSLMTRTEVVTVAAATAGETPEYELVLLHFTKSGTKVQQKLHIRKFLSGIFEKVENSLLLLGIDSRHYACIRDGYITLKERAQPFSKISLILAYCLQGESCES